MHRSLVCRRHPVRVPAVVLIVTLLGLIVAPGRLGADVPSPAGEFTTDRAFTLPHQAFDAAVVTELEDLLAVQAEALGRQDPHAYLETFDRGAASGPAKERAGHALFSALAAGSRVVVARVTPSFFAPGPDGSAEVLAHHVVAYRLPDGTPGLLDLPVMERLRRDGDGRWRVYDWVATNESGADSSWLTWVDGAVTLEPFAARLSGEMTYRFFPGAPAFRGRILSFDLEPAFEVERVYGPSGDLAWERRGGSVMVTLDPTSSGPDRVLEVTLRYQGRVGPASGAGGNLEVLDAEGIYLRPDTGWYPRPGGNGVLRGQVRVTLPGIWSAAVSGSLVGISPPGEERTYTWALPTPAELYLAAGPYKTAQSRTADGVTVRTFFYPRGAEHAPAYLREAERILEFFSERFGPYPYPNLSLIEVSRFYFSGLSARCFVLLDRSWIYDPETDAGSRDLLAHEIAHQWWGELIPIWSSADWYLWEGLATYSEALYGESRGGRDELARLMKDRADIYADAVSGRTPISISEANVRTEDWHDNVVYEKGAWVFHMLRGLLGDEAFFDLLRTYLTTFTGRQPYSADFERLALKNAAHYPYADYLIGYFGRWVEGTDEVDFALAGLSQKALEDGSVRLEFEIRDQGTGDYPEVRLAAVLRDGTTETFRLAPGPQSLELPDRVRAVVVDPYYEVLDLDRGDNRYLFIVGLAVPAAVLDGFRTGLSIGLGLVALGVLWSRRRRRRRPGAPAGVDSTPSGMVT